MQTTAYLVIDGAAHERALALAQLTFVPCGVEVVKVGADGGFEDCIAEELKSLIIELLPTLPDYGAGAVAHR